MSKTQSGSSAGGGALKHFALLFGAPLAAVRPRPAELDGLSDHLLRDIGRARGAGGRDRLHKHGS